jgi:hypothetical protein
MAAARLATPLADRLPAGQGDPDLSVGCFGVHAVDGAWVPPAMSRLTR